MGAKKKKKPWSKLVVEWKQRDLALREKMAIDWMSWAETQKFKYNLNQQSVELKA